MIYGHSYKYEEKHCGETVYLNPGGCGPKRFRLPVTMMVLTLYPQDHRMETTRLDFTSAASKKEAPRILEKDMYRLIEEIIKEVDAGRAVADIAARKRVDEKLAEKICRIYVTHPGVDIDGILNRMEKME